MLRGRRGRIVRQRRKARRVVPLEVKRHLEIGPPASRPRELIYRCPWRHRQPGRPRLQVGSRARVSLATASVPSSPLDTALTPAPAPSVIFNSTGLVARPERQLVDRLKVAERADDLDSAPAAGDGHPRVDGAERLWVRVVGLVAGAQHEVDVGL